jgi:hypothetical protein
VYGFCGSGKSPTSPGSRGFYQRPIAYAGVSRGLRSQIGLLDSRSSWAAKWDLITMIYAGANAKLVARIKPSLKQGGLFISEYFHAESDVAKTGAGGWATGELAALFKDGFKILRDDVVEDNADWAGQRKTKLVRFVAQKL